MVSRDAARGRVALKVSNHDGLPNVGPVGVGQVGHKKWGSRDAAPQSLSPRARSESVDRTRKPPDMTPKKMRKLPRPQAHHQKELARPEKRPEPQKQSREARTSSASSRKARSSSASSRSRKARASSSSSRSRKARNSSSFSRSRSPRAKQKASSSGAQRSRPSPLRGRLWGFDVSKYDGNWKGATVDFFRRLQRSDPKDPPFGTYHTVRDEEGLYHSTLQLTDKARAAARLKKLQYKGEGAHTIKAAELSAARVLWDDPRIREQAAKLRPGKTALKHNKNYLQHNARRKALWLGRQPVHSAQKKEERG